MEGIIYEDDYIIQILPHSFELNYQMGKYYGNKYDNIALISEMTSLHQKNAEFFKKGVEDANENIILDEIIMENDNDFNTVLLRIKNSNADSIANFLFADKRTILINQFFNNKLNYTLDLLGEPNYEIEFESYKEKVNPKYLEGMEIIGYEYADNIYFEQQFNLKYNYKPQLVSFLAYDAVNILVPILMNSYDTINIKNEILENSNYQGVLGNYSFDENGVSKMDMFLKQYHNGEFQVISRIK